MNRRSLIAPAALSMLLVSSALIAQEPPAARPDAALYRVTIDVLPGDDPAVIARQLAATYRGRIEPYAEEGFTGFAISMTESAARLLANDPRVVAIEQIPAAGTSTPVPERQVQAAAIPPDNVESNATGSTWSIGPYAYDSAGNVKSIGSQSGTDYYVYDNLGRLLSGTAGPGRNQQYSFDDFGNITSIITDSGSAVGVGANPSNNRIDNASYPIFGSYDGEGNMTSYTGTDTFAYDGLGMIKESYVAGVRQVHLYTPGDERIVSVTIIGSSEGRSEWTIRDMGGAPLRRFVRQNGTWSWNEDYIYGGDFLLAAEVPTAAKTLHFHPDHLGTPRLITGNGGAEISRHTYYPFGREINTSLAERLKFTGHERDAANLDYMHARYYMPFLGRFLSPDPIWPDIGSPQMWNRYAYVENSPLSAIDPDGLFSISITVEAEDPIHQWIREFDMWVFRRLEELSNASAGFGDTMTFGATEWAREALSKKMFGTNTGVDKCSTAYAVGVYTEIAAEIALTAGSSSLKTAAAAASRKSVRSAARKMTAKMARANGERIHHIQPLFGHPGGAPTMFPTGGLPAWLHSGRWNTQALSHSQHMAAHRKLRRLEAGAGALFNPGTTSLRAGVSAGNRQDCP